MDLKFLMSSCRYCSAPARGKYYKALLILTPLAIIFYIFIVAAFLYVGWTHLGSDTSVKTVATVLSILLFLTPGLFILFMLKNSKGVCDSCMKRGNYEIVVPAMTPPPLTEPMLVRPEKESRVQSDRRDQETVAELLNSNPSAKEVIDRNWPRIPVITLPIAQKVVQATTYEWANNIEEAAQLYESLDLKDEATRVRSKNRINLNTEVKGLEKIG